MTLHNYWWLLIWPLLFGGVSAVFIPKREEYVLGKKETRWHWLPALILVLPFVIWSAWRTNEFGDTGVYRSQFFSTPPTLTNIGEFLSEQPKDKGFALITILFKSLISRSDIAYFFVFATIQMFLLVLVYRKYSANFWLSFFLFVASGDYLSWMHNGMRQFVIVTILFACLPLIIERRYVLMAAITLILSTVHLSTLIFLPFIFVVNGKAWNTRTLLFIFAVIISTFFIDRISNVITNAMEDTAYSNDIVHFVEDDGTHIIRVLFYSIPTIMTLIFRREIDAANDPMINTCTNLSVISSGFYVISYFTSGILIGRIPIYFSLANYILIPWMLEKVFSSKSALFMQIAFVVLYIGFFYYQVGIAWGLL